MVLTHISYLTVLNIVGDAAAVVLRIAALTLLDHYLIFWVLRTILNLR